MIPSSRHRPVSSSWSESRARYRQLLESAVAVTRATGVDGSQEVLKMLQARAVIEQAKGAIIGKIHCTPDHAWQCLRETSQSFNVKLRDVAIALVELLSKVAAEQPPGIPRPSVATAADAAAAKLWRSLDSLTD